MFCSNFPKKITWNKTSLFCRVQCFLNLRWNFVIYPYCSKCQVSYFVHLLIFIIFYASHIQGLPIMFEMIENKLKIWSNHLLFYILMTLYTVRKIFWRTAKQQDISIAKLWNLKINLKMIIKKAGINFNNFGVTLNR